MTAFTFLTAAWLLLIPVIWGVLWALARNYRRQSRWHQFCDPHLLEHMITDQSTGNNARWLIWPLALLLTLAAIAMAGPSWREQSSPLLESVSARVLALDLSGSMLVEDVKPSRFKQAIASARNIVSTDYSGETGLVVYAGAAFVVSPLTRDASTLRAFLDALSPETMPLAGNRIDLAIDTAADLLSASISKRGNILVITGGTSDIDAAVQASAEASERGHRISVLAVGTQAGGPMKNPQGGLMRDADGKVILARTEFAELARIAEIGGGVFAGIPTNTDVAIFTQHSGPGLASLESIDDSINIPANDGIWLVWIMLPLALLLFRRNAFWVVLVALTVPNDHELYAMDWQTLSRNAEQRAVEAYQQGDFPTVLAISTNALTRGSAHYRLQQYEQALEAFSQSDSALAFYNRGNALAQLHKFTEAVLAYKQALVIDPKLEDAKVNLQLLEAYLSQSHDADSNGDGDEEGDSAAETLEQASAGLSRSGAGSERSENPGDAQQAGFGVGASTQSGPPDLTDEFDGRDPQLELFMLQQGAAIDLPERAIVERWIDSLPQASTDLFQRKFLRDYNRQKNQSR